MKRAVLLLVCLAGALALVAACCPRACCRYAEVPPQPPMDMRVPPQPPIRPPEEAPKVSANPESLLSPLPPPTPQKTAMLRTVHFDFDRSAIRPGDADIIKANAAYLNGNPSIKVTCEGYCDPVGTEEYNRALGLRRANAAKNYLVELGIDPGRLSVLSFGEDRLVTTNPAEFEQNRRVEFSQR